jgi:hypothetical protein
VLLDLSDISSIWDGAPDLIGRIGHSRMPISAEY